MELRQIALEVARILQDAGKHALNDQMNPHDMRKLEVSEDCFHFTSDTDKRLQQFISNRLTYVNVFDGFWQLPYRIPGITWMPGSSLFRTCLKGGNLGQTKWWESALTSLNAP